jgi:P27 family predicted phage terminase small subunit
MGLRGPPPTPTKILEGRGSWRAKANPREPLPERGKPAKPRYLKGLAARTWSALVDQLDRIGVLTKIDQHALARYCELFEQYRQTQEFIQENGRQYPVRRWDEGTNAWIIVDYKIFPEVSIFMQLSDKLLKLEKEFGLTPSARSRIEIHPEPKKKNARDKRDLLRVG